MITDLDSQDPFATGRVSETTSDTKNNLVFQYGKPIFYRENTKSVLNLTPEQLARVQEELQPQFSNCPSLKYEVTCFERARLVVARKFPYDYDTASFYLNLEEWSRRHPDVPAATQQEVHAKQQEALQRLEWHLISEYLHSVFASRDHSEKNNGYRDRFCDKMNTFIQKTVSKGWFGRR